ncbi:hypothetical protein M378DRAFT_265561, partial [Amanita muscaria Koide BX008]
MSVRWCLLRCVHSALRSQLFFVPPSLHLSLSCSRQPLSLRCGSSFLSNSQSACTQFSFTRHNIRPADINETR